MSKVNTDSNPINDLLNRRRFAKDIARSLQLSFSNGDSSFVFGLNGKWGTGKTTLMGYLKDEINSETKGLGNIILFDFNPWTFSGKEELTFFFLKELSKKITEGNKKLKDKLTILARSLAFAENLKYLNSGLGDAIAALKNLTEEFLSSQDNVENVKAEIDEILVKDEIRLFVFIDDLDRLTPKEVVQIFQIIKLNASFKNTVFIVSFDKEVVQGILSESHGFDGEKYLEKIIQVDYRIPDLLDETIEEIFFNDLQSFFIENKISLDEEEFKGIWLVERMKFYFRTLRDINRYFNALKLRLPSIKDDVDVRQFCIIEAIRIFDYTAYEVIQRNYKKKVFFGPQTEATRILFQAIENETTKALFEYLFQSNSQSTFPISDPLYFDRYFSLSISPFDTSKDTLKIFVKDRKSRSHIIQNTIAKGIMKSFLRAIKKEKEIELFAVNQLMQWARESEEAFVDCHQEFIDVIGHIIQINKDFANGINYLVSILGGDSGFFNPAKFYVTYFLNHIALNDDKSVFSEHRDVIRNNRKALDNSELDILKRYENDNLVFQRPDYRADFFHKLFLLCYRKRFNLEYNGKLETYLSVQFNIFLFIRYVLRKDAGEFAVDKYWVENLLDSRILNLLDVGVKEIFYDGLTSEYKDLFEAYHAHRDKIGVIISRIEMTEMEN